MMNYRVRLSDGRAGKTEDLDANCLEKAIALAEDRADAWARDGEWGDEGACVCAHWAVLDKWSAVLENGCVTVDIEPNHAALIRKAGGDPKCKHDWAGEGYGGCDEDPGVSSMSGTKMSHTVHCTKCNLIRVEVTMGSQRNPGEHDTVEYFKSERERQRDTA